MEKKKRGGKSFGAGRGRVDPLGGMGRQARKSGHEDEDDRAAGGPYGGWILVGRGRTGWKGPTLKR
jgi:hypothetical protein